MNGLDDDREFVNLVLSGAEDRLQKLEGAMSAANAVIKLKVAEVGLRLCCLSGDHALHPILPCRLHPETRQRCISPAPSS